VARLRLAAILLDNAVEVMLHRRVSEDLARANMYARLSYTATLFASRIRDPLHVERSPSYVLSTLSDPTTNVGLELLGT
jgi:hypothetical protein